MVFNPPLVGLFILLLILAIGIYLLNKNNNNTPSPEEEFNKHKDFKPFDLPNEPTLQAVDSLLPLALPNSSINFRKYFIRKFKSEYQNLGNAHEAFLAALDESQRHKDYKTSTANIISADWKDTDSLIGLSGDFINRDISHLKDKNVHLGNTAPLREEFHKNNYELFEFLTGGDSFELIAISKEHAEELVAKAKSLGLKITVNQIRC